MSDSAASPNKDAEHGQRKTELSSPENILGKRPGDWESAEALGGNIVTGFLDSHALSWAVLQPGPRAEQASLYT